MSLIKKNDNEVSLLVNSCWYHMVQNYNMYMECISWPYMPWDFIYQYRL
jgi:hypothetical protein